MTTMTSKGQVTIPKKVRDLLGLKPGSQVEFDITPGGDAIVRASKRRPKSPFAKLLGSAKGKFTTEDIMRLTRGDEWPNLK